jgi:hypothetical protein
MSNREARIYFCPLSYLMAFPGFLPGVNITRRLMVTNKRPGTNLVYIGFSEELRSAIYVDVGGIEYYTKLN